MLQSAEGLGYDDLNELMKDPQPLTFILELLKISQVAVCLPKSVMFHILSPPLIIYQSLCLSTLGAFVFVTARGLRQGDVADG